MAFLFQHVLRKQNLAKLLEHPVISKELTNEITYFECLRRLLVRRGPQIHPINTQNLIAPSEFTARISWPTSKNKRNEDTFSVFTSNNVKP